MHISKNCNTVSNFYFIYDILILMGIYNKLSNNFISDFVISFPTISYPFSTPSIHTPINPATCSVPINPATCITNRTNIQPIDNTYKQKFEITRLSKKTQLKKWTPHEFFNASEKEIVQVIKTYYDTQKKEKNFYEYFKNMEKKLIYNLKLKVNQCYNIPEKSWFELNKSLWRNLALLRDLHDFICGRDKKHHIRTDDCRRFIPGIIKLFNENIVINPVYRILYNKKNENKFTHPLFLQFN